MLDVLPRATRAVQAEGAGPAAMDGPVAGSGGPRPPGPAARIEVAESAAPVSDEQTTASDEPSPAMQTADARIEAREATVAQTELPDPAVLEVPDQTDRATAFECPIEDSTFCEVLDLTDPYRRANQERDLGLALEALEPDNPLWMAAVSASTSACPTTIRI